MPWLPISNDQLPTQVASRLSHALLKVSCWKYAVLPPCLPALLGATLLMCWTQLLSTRRMVKGASEHMPLLNSNGSVTVLNRDDFSQCPEVGRILLRVLWLSGWDSAWNALKAGLCGGIRSCDQGRAEQGMQSRWELPGLWSNIISICPHTSVRCRSCTQEMWSLVLREVWALLRKCWRSRCY